MISCEHVKTFAALPRTERGQYIVLGNDPKNENFLYANGNSVIIRNIEDESISDVYTQHSHRVTVAKYSPSRYYIASADMNGKIRIWDTTQKEHVLKAEYQPISGVVNDISWSSDNSKLAIGGKGRESFGAVINVEMGTNVGTVSGMSKAVNNIDMKPTRPFRLATSAEDSTVCFLEGPPFKFKTSHLVHTNFANCLRYSPNGDYFVSAGADGKMFLFDGKDGSLLNEIGNPAHNGGIYSISFSGDSKHLVSVGGDKTVRLWSIPERELVKEHLVGNAVSDIQVGCVWCGDNVISVSLSGEMVYFKADSLISGDGKPYKRVSGHQKPITKLKLDKSGQLISSDSDGRMLIWDAESAATKIISGDSKIAHNCQVMDLISCGRELYSVGVDDRIVLSDLDSYEYREGLKLNSQPRRIEKRENFTLIACYKELVILHGLQIVHSCPVSFEPVCMAVSPDGKILVVGGETEMKIFIYTIQDNNSLKSAGELELFGSPRDLCFSPDGSLLICGDTDRTVHAFKVDPNSNLSGDCSMIQVHPDIKQKWKYHTARISSVAISPNSKLVASGSLDCNIIIWNVNKPNEKCIVKNAHPMSNINSLVWLDDTTLFSAGQDSNIKKWKITVN